MSLDSWLWSDALRFLQRLQLGVPGSPVLQLRSLWPAPAHCYHRQRTCTIK